MNRYDLTVILRNKDLESLKGKMDTILKKHGVTVVQDNSWGIRKLTYMIEGEKEGFYAHMLVEAPPESVKKVLSDFRLISDFLRYLFVRLEQEKSA